MTGKVLTANRVGTGLVVFWSADEQWVDAIDDAFVVVGADAAAALEALVPGFQAGTDVTDVYVIDATREGAHVRPAHIRERIRSLGPTVREDLGKQATGTGGAFGATA